MKIYVMRHGQTVWNSKGITQGVSHNKLSKAGKEQALMTAQKSKDLKFDVIICSPLMRTVQTANIINQFHNVKIEKNEKITEIDQGIFTGRKFKTLTAEEREIKAKRASVAKMESLQSVVLRVENFIRELKENYAEKSVLVVTHNIVASAIEAISTLGKFDDDIFRKQVSFDNAEIKEIEI